MTLRIFTIFLLTLQCLALQLVSACHRAEVPASTAAIPQVQAPVVASDTVLLNSDAARSANIQTFIVEDRSGSTEIKTTGEIKADEGRVFHINSIVSGRVVKDTVALGQSIKEGQILAVVQNLEVSKVYGEFIHQSHQNEIAVKEAAEKLDLYRKTLDRAKLLFDEGIGAQKDLIQAQSQVNITEIELNGQKEHAIHIKSEAEAMLSAYGVKLKDSGDSHFIETGSPLRSPRSGVVIQKNITMGDVVTAEQPLYVVADLSKVWLDVSVYDKDLDSIGLGQQVKFRSDSLANRTFEGIISYLPPSATNMRTFTARAVLANPSQLLKPGMFGQVLIEKENPHRMPFLPDSAVQKYGSETFAFVRVGPDRYQKRIIELGQRDGDGFLVSQGIKAGECAVGDGSFKLKSEMLKTQAGQDD